MTAIPDLEALRSELPTRRHAALWQARAAELSDRALLPLLVTLAIEDDYSEFVEDDNGAGGAPYAIVTARPNPAPGIIAGILKRSGIRPTDFGAYLERLALPGAHNPYGMAQVLIEIAAREQDVKALRLACGSDQAQTRGGALYALARLRQPGCVEALISGLEDPHPRVVAIAAEGLWHLLSPPQSPQESVSLSRDQLDQALAPLRQRLIARGLSREQVEYYQRDWYAYSGRINSDSWYDILNFYARHPW